MSINIWTDSMQHAALLGKPVLFTNWLIQRDIIPDGWYCYDLRGTHKSPSTRTTLVDHAADYDNDKTAVLNLPAADAGIWRAVEKVDAASVDECAFRCVDCLIPFLRDAINNAIDDEDGIEQADEFAKRLAQIEREWPESDMVKYKALLSVVDHPSLQDATRLMGEIDQYELRPEVAQTWGYAEMMFREKYSALPEELFQTPQAAQIGQKMLDDRLGVITEYGLIRRKDGQPLPVFQPEQEIGQGLEMM